MSQIKYSHTIEIKGGKERERERERENETKIRRPCACKNLTVKYMRDQS